MYVIPLYPQPIFHTNPIVHSSVLLCIPPWLPSFPLVPSSHSLTLQSPDTLDGGFPSGPRPSGSPSGPKASLAPHGLKELGCTTGAVAPPVVEVTLSDTDVSCWYIFVFSSNVTNLFSSSCSSLPNLLRCPFSLSIYYVECG